MKRPLFSFVIPIYNEEESLPALVPALHDIFDDLDGDVEVILVDDGSRDQSAQLMYAIHESDPRFKLIQFSRNFGHQIAITAGMDMAAGDAVIIMDADLQDPPQVAVEMVELWRQGFDVVYGVRDEREGESWFKRASAAFFYRLLRKLTDLDIPVDTGDFRLVDRKALDAFRSLREHNRYVRGMMSWVGFSQKAVKYKRDPRRFGKTKYPFYKMLRLAIDAILSFTLAPLHVALHIGLAVSGISFLIGVIVIVQRLLGFPGLVRGWASLVVVVSFLGGMQLAVLGIIGEYIGRIYREVQARPLYIVRNTVGFDQ